MSEIQDEDIITLTDENGNDVEFLLLDVVEYNNDDYMVMIPLDDEEIEDDDEQDEVVILKVIRRRRRRNLLRCGGRGRAERRL